MGTQVHTGAVATGAAGWSRAKRAGGRDVTRQAIIDAALRLFAQSGYVGVRVEDIAREAGVSRATFYKHFAERDQILAELFGRLLDGSTVPPDTVPAGPVATSPGLDGDVSARITTLLLSTARQMQSEELLARFVYSLPVRHDAVLPGGSAEPAVFARVRDELTAAVEAGELREGVTVERVMEVLGIVFEAAMRDWALDRADDPVERLDELLQTVFGGVSAR